MKVYVALSGGVDSAVCAALLKQKDWDVFGVHMKLTTDFLHGLTRTNPCAGQSDLDSAHEVAGYLNIPFEVWDFTKEYEKEVIEYLFRQYEAGRTPNPDVMCNRHIKFGLFYDKAMAQGADFVATGHYARITRKLESRNPKSETNPKSQIQISKRFEFPALLRGVDPNKDQSYFLWAISKDRLGKIIFPIGDKLKTEVRTLAKAFGLPNADRKDSQGVCFIGKIDLPEFLKLRIRAKSGEVVTTQGQKIGEHQGAWFYTIGQRHGFGSAQGLPQYVVEKDVKTNRLVVADNSSKQLYSREAIVGNINWLSGVKGQWSGVSCQARYRQKPILIQRITKESKGKLRIRFAEPAWALATGQSMVLYQNDVVIGGGIIEKAN